MQVRLASLAVALTALFAPPAYADALAGVRVLSCSPWQEGAGGSVAYVARMGAVPGTARMSLRIRLFEKYGNGKFERVSADQLGIWRKSHRGASEFRWEQNIDGLRQGTVYRVVVGYRWYATDGALLRTERRRSAECRQGGGLPNLRVASVETRSGDVEGTAVYRVKIVNSGVSTARNVGVLLRVDGEVVDEAEVIAVLEPNEARAVTFNGPVCRKRMRVVVDPKGLIPESRERDNVLASTCL